MRTFPSAVDRQRVARQLPPVKCSARSSRSGQPCKRWAVIGGSVCPAHGGMAPQTRAKASARVALAEALADGERRPLWEILLDSIHVSDVLARREIADLRLAPEVTAEHVERLVAAIERSARLSRSGIDAGLAERRMKFDESTAAQMSAVFDRTMDLVGLTREQRARVPEALRTAIAEKLGIGRAPVAIQAEVVDRV